MGLFQNRSKSGGSTPSASPPQLVDYVVTVLYSHPASVVWEHLDDPSLLLSENTVFGGRVEGSPLGVGEIWLNVREGTGPRHIHASETTEYEEGRRRALRALPNYDRGIVTDVWEYKVEPISDDSCVVRFRSATEWRIKPDSVPRYRQIFEAEARAGLVALSDSLDEKYS